jgi:uncharacterized membrane protein YraQ (UPF0718 family)/YHS domain-containing protein
VHALIDIGHSLRMGFFMFWETLWALVLGFGLSGAVQAFVSREEMQRMLGGRGPREIARATAFGAASSSCSYAAAAMAKSLFQRGAEFTSSMVFMFASTNLVIELGIVLWVLIGWQFAAAEFVGGVVMIVLFALLARASLQPHELERARERLTGGDLGHLPASPAPSAPWRVRLKSAVGWADAASYALADAKMLRKEMAAGYAIAGFLAVLVPTRVWRGVFLTGHGFATSVENVLIGPLIAIVSFVCSIGNVPLAAALWQGGISFGGVVSFIFADLITLPLLLIYRRYYGGRLTLRLLALFWSVMSAAGLVVQYLFDVAGLVPAKRPVQIVDSAFHWNATSFLNIVFLGVFGLLWWLARNQERLGGGVGYAIDPVCGMQVQTRSAPARASYGGETFYFCADRCRARFEREPARYTERPGGP